MCFKTHQPCVTWTRTSWTWPRKRKSRCWALPRNCQQTLVPWSRYWWYRHSQQVRNTNACEKWNTSIYGVTAWENTAYYLKSYSMCLYSCSYLGPLWFGYRSRNRRAHWGGCRSSQHLQAREEGLVSVQAQPPVHRGSTSELHWPLTEIYEDKHADTTYYCLLEMGRAVSPTSNQMET